MSSPLPLNPLEIYCHALSRRPPCRHVEDSLYEGKAFTTGPTGRGGSSVRAVAVTALVTGRRAGLRRFQISPNHGFHRKSDSLSSREKAGVATALVTGRGAELRRFQISPGHGFYRKGDLSLSRKREIPQSRAPLKRPLLVVEGENSPRRCTCCRGGKRAWRHRPEWSVVPA